MTTKIIKAYDRHDTHTIFNAANRNHNYALAGAITKAWDICEMVDYIPEWDEQEPSVIIMTLCEEGHTELAYFLRDELIKEYGDADVTVEARDSWDW